MDKDNFLHLLKKLSRIMDQKNKAIAKVLELDDKIVEILDEEFNEYFTKDSGKSN